MSSFRVVYPQPATDSAKLLLSRAQECGLVAEFMAALKSLDEQLQDQGRTLGEEIHSLPFTKQKVRHAICYPVVVYWAVHDEDDLVFVKNYKWLPD